MPRGRKEHKRHSTGAHDKHPQTMQTSFVTAANSNWLGNTLEVPILNIGIGQTPSVLEITKVEAVLTGASSHEAFIGIGSFQANGLTTTNYSYSTMAQDKRMVTCFRTGSNVEYVMDLTDEAGNGLLYPGQELIVNLSSVDTASASWVVKVYYRIKKASLQEYLGIVNQYIVTQI